MIVLFYIGNGLFSGNNAANIVVVPIHKSLMTRTFINRHVLFLATSATIFFCFFLPLTFSGETYQGFVQIGFLESIFTVRYADIYNKPLWVLHVVISAFSMIAECVMLSTLFLNLSDLKFRLLQISLVLLLVTNVTHLFIFRNNIGNKLSLALFIISSVVLFVLTRDYFKQFKASRQ